MISCPETFMKLAVKEYFHQVLCRTGGTIPPAYVYDIAISSLVFPLFEQEGLDGVRGVFQWNGEKVVELAYKEGNFWMIGFYKTKENKDETSTV